HDPHHASTDIILEAQAGVLQAGLPAMARVPAGRETAPRAEPEPFPMARDDRTRSDASEGAQWGADSASADATEPARGGTLDSSSAFSSGSLASAANRLV